MHIHTLNQNKNWCKFWQNKFNYLNPGAGTRHTDTTILDLGDPKIDIFNKHSKYILQHDPFTLFITLYYNSLYEKVKIHKSDLTI